MTESQANAALVATLETEIVRLRAVNAELRKSIQAPVQPDTELTQAARQALEALRAIAAQHGQWSNGIWAAGVAGKAATALREALEAAPHQITEPAQKPVAWIYTSELGGNQTYVTRFATDLTTYRADKVQPLYTAPQPAREPLTDERVKVKLGSQYGDDLAGHWFYLHPADEYAEAVLDKPAHGIGGAA